jgi:hypothetical protein
MEGSKNLSIGASTLATRAETFALEATLVRNYVIADEYKKKIENDSVLGTSYPDSNCLKDFWVLMIERKTH